MKQLIANLKVYFQIPKLYLGYLFIGCAFVPLINVGIIGDCKSFTTQFQVFFFLLYCGFLVGLVQKEVLARPVTFCLPKPRGYSTWIVLGWGIVVSSLVTFLLMKKLDSPGPQWPLSDVAVFLAIWLTAMAIFLFYVLFTLKVNPGGKQALAFFAGMAGSLFLFRESLMGYPAWGIVGGGLVSFFCWRRLEDESLVRDLCAEEAPLFFLSMNTREMSKSHIAKMPEKKTTLGDSWFAWFLPLMKRARQGSTVRNGTGFSFYLIENFSLAHPAIMPAILLVTASFFCYFAGSMNDGKIRLMSNFIYIYPMILSMRIVMLDSFPRRQTFLFRRGGRNGSWGPFMPSVCGRSFGPD